MTKGEVIFIGGIIGSMLLALAMTLGYHLYTNSLNRQAYYECLRVTEEIAKADNRTGVRITSTPSCYLR
jgi:hypothetical protein